MESLSLFGEKAMRAQFGFAIAVAGDLNKDGYLGQFKFMPIIRSI